MHKTSPPDLFDSAEASMSESNSKPLAVGAAKAKRSPLQQEFDRLSARIEEGQALLATWQQQPAIMLQKFNAQMEPALRELADAQKTLIVQIDALLTSPPKGLRMTARRRDALTDCLLDHIDMLMEDGLDDTLVEIHNRHADEPIDEDEDEDSEDDAQAQTAEILDLFRQMFGEGSIERQPDESHEAFVDRARAELFERMEAEERKEDAERRKRAEKRAARKKAKQGAKAQPASGKGDAIAAPGPDLLRTLYRKLASSIHPDREHDPAEKTRKTEAMQSLNTAYQSKDLLSLLKLHRRTLQTEAADDALAEDTLREYNALLKTQLKSLEFEIETTIRQTVPPHMAFGRGRLKRPEQLERLMDADIRKTLVVAESIRATVRDLNDPKLRTRVVNELVEITEAGRYDDEFDAMPGEFYR
jgi:hypothetical protein